MEMPQWKKFINLENRYIAPIFITLILLVGHLTFGILESYQKTLLAIAASIGAELILSRLFLANGRLLPARISVASAWGFCFGRRRSGHTRCAASYRLP